MTSLGAMLKSEITRLARKEIRAQMEAVKKTSSIYRRDIAALKRQVVDQQRAIAALGRSNPTDAQMQPNREAVSTG